MGRDCAMKTIWKWPLPTGSCRFVINMPRDAKILCVQCQKKIPVVWALVDPKKEREEVVFYGHATGEPLDDIGQYVGTYQLLDGTWVFHVFTRREEP